MLGSGVVCCVLMALDAGEGVYFVRLEGIVVIVSGSKKLELGRDLFDSVPLWEGIVEGN